MWEVEIWFDLDDMSEEPETGELDYALGIKAVNDLMDGIGRYMNPVRKGTRQEGHYYYLVWDLPTQQAAEDVCLILGNTPYGQAQITKEGPDLPESTKDELIGKLRALSKEYNAIPNDKLGIVAKFVHNYDDWASLDEAFLKEQLRQRELVIDIYRDRASNNDWSTGLT